MHSGGVPTGVPGCVNPAVNYIHTSTVSEMLSSKSSVPEGQEFGSLWEKSRRHCAACLLFWAADASEMFWSKFVVVTQKREKKRCLCLP